MRTVKTSLALVAVMMVAAPAHADDSAAIEAAKTWYTGLLTAGLALAQGAPTSPDAQLTAPAPKVILGVFGRWNACKKLEASKQRSVAQLATCMAVLDHDGRAPNLPASFSVATLDEAVGTLATRLKKGPRARVASQIKRDGKGATVVKAHAGRDIYVDTFMAVQPDGTITAVWIFEDVQEMTPDSPGLTMPRHHRKR